MKDACIGSYLDGSETCCDSLSRKHKAEVDVNQLATTLDAKSCLDKIIAVPKTS